ISLLFFGHCDRTLCFPSFARQRLNGVSSHAKRKIYRSRRHSHPLVRSRFLPHLARQKDEILDIVRNRGLGKPTLLAWSYQDPSRAPNKQPHRTMRVRCLKQLRHARTLELAFDGAAANSYQLSYRSQFLTFVTSTAVEPLELTLWFEL